MRYLIGLPLGILGLVAAFFLLGNLWVLRSTAPYIYSTVESLPANDVALLLGTSPYSRKGNENVLFQHRIDAAATLYKAGKIKHVLASGANPDETYNEPRKMYYALVEAGVPGEAITLDFAGFRTLDSVIRAAEVFRLPSYTVISQRFHLHRAVFIARHEGINAIAYAPPENKEQKRRLRVREALARVNTILDVVVLRTRPRFLGAPEPIVLQPKVEVAKPSPAAAPPLAEGRPK